MCHHLSELLYKDELLLFEFLILSKVAIVLVVRSLELHSMPQVVTSKSIGTELLKSKFLSNYCCSLIQAQVTHLI